MKIDELKVGKKFGCLTIVGGPEVYYEEKAKYEIQKLEEEKNIFLHGEKGNNNFKSVETFDAWIENFKNTQKYKCQCKCGKIQYLNFDILIKKRWQKCSDDCSLAKERQQKLKDACPREKHSSYYLNLINTNFKTLEILECINDNFEGEPLLYNKRKLGEGICYVYKLYKCRCSLCGKEYQFRSDKFEVEFTSYGPKAKDGYYCDTHCNCHPISSFQWRTIKIFQQYNVKYRAEVFFDGLYGIGHKNLLRYDFAVMDDQNNIKCLIECQGEQHNKPVKEYGGKKAYNIQFQNDELKRKYAKENNILLIEIPHTCNTYEKEVEFLTKNKIINII